MKKIVLMVLTLVLAVGCANKSCPDMVVAKCWTLLANGDVEGAVELMNVAPEERGIYVEMYAQHVDKLRAAGGVESVVVDSCAEGEEDATVEATVVLANGSRVEAQYRLVKVGRKWKIED